MDAELQVLEQSIQRRLAQVVECLDVLSETQLNWRPSPEANSAYALAAHTMGNARAWVLGIACGQDLRRDRPGEFASSGADGTSLREQHAALSRAIADALAALDPARLDVRLVPSQELKGEGPPREISVRDALVQVIEHASLHLGHLQLTRDLALRAAGTP
jgi:hypothetical protein